MEEIITVTKDNLEPEHVCCTISNNNDFQVLAKKLGLLKDLMKVSFSKSVNV